MATWLRCGQRSQRGYAMAALLVALGAMAVFAGVAMPVWRTVVQRENEEELIFRGQQYVRSIRLYQRKFANAFPPSLDLLVEQRFLRKKYTDPMTGNGEFVIIYQNMLQQTRPGAAGRGGVISGRAGEITQPETASTPQLPLANLEAAGPRGGIAGVVSKSTGKTFRTYNGRSVYNEWQFIFVQTGQPGRGGVPVPGGRGGGRAGPGMTQPGRGTGGPPAGRGPGGRGAGGGGRGPGGGRGGPGTLLQPE